MPTTRRQFIQATAGGSLGALAALQGISLAAKEPSPATPPASGDGGALQVTPLQHGLLRVRHVRGGAPTAASLNEKVGFVLPGAAREKNAPGLTAQTAPTNPFSWELLSAPGASVGVFTLVPQPGGGFTLSATAQPQDGWYGLGFHRQKMELHGLRMRWERHFRHREATVPFFFSTAGYGVFCNTPWPQTFDFAQPGQWSLTADAGDCDVFLICGPSPKEILDGYTRLCGRPQLPPKWALDLLFICRYFERQPGVEAIARTFRERDIPCGMIGLEPGWEARPYSMKWQWSEKRFPDPRQMIAQLHAQGFHFELWESGAALDSGFTDPAVRTAWFAQRVGQSLDLGVDFFKQDDPYPRGITTEEMQEGVERELKPQTPQEAEAVNISNSLYCETVMQQIERHRGHRGLVIFNSYFASVAAHRWPTAWAADFASGTGLVNASLSAHGMVSLDMDGATPAGMHYGYLTPFSILDAWAYYKEPWRYPPHLEAAHRFYAKLRSRLAPHLYSAAWAAHTCGLPMMRPLLLEHPEDATAREISSSYYLGDGLLVGLEEHCYLPAGRWIDYWTGASQDSPGARVHCTWPEPAGGPLWVRAGSIIVTRPVTPHAYAEDDSVLIAELFPDARGGETKLYEDDGVSLAYRDGACRITHLSCRLEKGSVDVAIQQLFDRLKNTDARRGYLLKIHSHLLPTEVSWLGQSLPEKDSYAGLVQAEGQRGWCRDAHAPYFWVKIDPHWHFVRDHRGAGDPEADTPRWTGGPKELNGRLHVRLGSQAIKPRPLQQESPRPADNLRLLLNPPERIALKDGSWLKKQTTVYAWLEAVGKPVPADGVVVQLEVFARDGRLLRTAAQETKNGWVEFRHQAYEPGDTTFRVHTASLRSEDARVRPAPAI